MATAAADAGTTAAGASWIAATGERHVPAGGARRRLRARPPPAARPDRGHREARRPGPARRVRRRARLRRALAARPPDRLLRPVEPDDAVGRPALRARPAPSGRDGGAR